MARATMLTAGIVTAALLALLAVAPLASAASNPVGTNSTATVTLNNGFVKGLKKKGVKTSAVSPAKLKGAKLTLKVTGGTIDPTTGQGTINLGGGLKFKAGKKSTTVKRLVLNVTKGPIGAKLTGNVGGKNAVFATITGFSSARNGFGVNLTIKQLKLSGKAATQLNKKLGLKGKAKAFKGNKVMGSAKADVQPSTVGVLATGAASLKLSQQALEKLATIAVPVTLSIVPPTTITDLGPPPTVAFPFAPEGTISPALTSGTVKTAGGLKLTQNLGPGGETKLTLGNIWVDLATKSATVEVTIENDKTPALNLGNLGRVSIADLNLTGATVNVDPATRTISIQNASATLQALTAATLNQVFVEPVEGKGKTKFAAGDPLGTFSFSAQTE
jgi:hypothetical protein